MAEESWDEALSRLQMEKMHRAMEALAKVLAAAKVAYEREGFTPSEAFILTTHTLPVILRGV